MTLLQVFVRKDKDNPSIRRVSSPALKDVPPIQVLERGWAHDGNAWIRGVDILDLHRVEVEHKEWLESLGYEVEYK